jgi:hypothetical protein
MANLMFGGSMATRKEYTPESYASAQAAGGARRSVGQMLARPRQPNPKPFLGGQFDAFRNAMQEAVGGYGAMAGEDFQRRVGEFLGGMNEIGALRSGGVQAGVDQFGREFGRQIGHYSSMASRDALGMAQQEHDSDVERAFRERQYQDAKRASKRRGIGKLLGGALKIGGALGIPGAGTIAGVFN